MKSILLLISLTLASQAIAVCNTPISRTNFSANSVLSSTKLNLDFNTAYTRLNELPGDCITDGTITSAKINDGTIVNADISASAAIARSKLGSVNYTLSTDGSGNFSTASTTYVDVTNLTASITTTGNPVEISLVPNNAATSAATLYISTSSANAYGYLKVVRSSTDVAETGIGSLSDASSVVGVTFPPSSFRVIDTPSAGTYTYKIQAKVTDAADIIAIGYSKLMVREL